MNNRKLLALGVVFLAAVPILSQSDKPAALQPPAARPSAPAPVHEKQLDDAGSKVFAQNCARCHTAPDCFSPHISGTIVMHMRSRASLSKKDEQDLLRFLNP
jgi:cytochrome c5